MPTLLFPDADALCRAVADGVVPARIVATSALAGLDDRARLWLRPDVEAPRDVLEKLARRGARIVEPPAEMPLTPVTCWAEVIPPRPAPLPTEDAVSAIFRLKLDQLVDVVKEVRRLRRDAALAFHFDENGGVLLRVERCPFHTLQGSLPAYFQQAPGVWVRGGWSHPLAASMRTEGDCALVDADGTWSWFTGITFGRETARFALECHTPREDESHPLDVVEVPLRLVHVGSASEAELWVLDEQPEEQLVALARQMGQAFVEKFRMALVAPAGRATALVRAESSRGESPCPVVTGLPCRAYRGLPNLFVPCGMNLSPPLRRDVLRRLLADDPDQLTLVLPDRAGTFAVARVNGADFQPLSNLIEFIVDDSAERIAVAKRRPVLEWEEFQLAEEPRASRNEPLRVRRGLLARLRDLWPRTRERRLPVPVVPPPEIPLPTEQVISAVESPARRSDWLERRGTLEGQFLAALASPDPAVRQALLPDLAVLNGQLGAFADAIACWLGALWQEENPPKYWAWGWLQAERQLARTAWGENDLDALVEAAPTPATVRVLAAAVVWLAPQGESAPLLALAPRIAALLDRHEEWLPARAAWLARRRLAAIVGPDALALARARDRLLARLFAQGLSLELDVPSFLRFAGRGAGESFQSVREWLARLRDSIQRWLGHLASRRPPGYWRRGDDGPDRHGATTRVLADLILACGLGRLGEHGTARQLGQTGLDALAKFDDPTCASLRRAFEYRLRRVLEGRPAADPLPAESWERSDGVVDEDGVLARYRVDCLRAACRVLEPIEDVHPFRVGEPDAQRRAWEQALELPGDCGAALGERIDRAIHSAEDTVTAIATGLEVAAGRAPSFVRELLRRLAPALDRIDDPLTAALACGRAIEAAARADLADAAGPFVRRLSAIFTSANGDFQSFAARLRRPLPADQLGGPEDLRRLESLAGRVLRAMRRLNLPPHRFFQAALVWVTAGESPIELRRSRLPALRALLHLNGGWFHLGADDRAVEVLDIARKALLYSEMLTAERGPLACAYAAALGEAPSRLAQGRVEEMLRDLAGVHDVRQTNTHFALTPLTVIDAVVTAFTGDDFALGPAARRWLDEEEFLVRRRMQADLRAVMAY